MISDSGQVEELRREVEDVNVAKGDGGTVTPPAEEQDKVEWATKVGSSGVEGAQEDGSGLLCPADTNGYHGTDEDVPDKGGPHAAPSPSPLPPPSPCTSPVLAKHATGTASPGGYHHSSYQAGINQRFHAARYKFQGAAETDPPPQAAQTPPPPPPPKEEPSPVKQMARSTVTQVLSRFTTAQQSAAAKLAAANSSPFGTDYRSLAAPLSPVVGRASGQLSLPSGVRSPTIPRADRGHPPPIPPKKPGLAQAPASPAAVPRSASHFGDSGLSGSCGLTSSQEGVKELDMVVSSN